MVAFSRISEVTNTWLKLSLRSLRYDETVLTEFIVFKLIPRGKQREDRHCGTIEDDEDFKEFKEAFEADKPEVQQVDRFAEARSQCVIYEAAYWQHGRLTYQFR